MSFAPVAFVAGPSVVDGEFFGRQSDIAALVSRLSAGTSTVLVGQSRIGKSSILRQISFLQKAGKLRDLDASAVFLPLHDPSWLQTNTIIHAVLGSLTDQPANVAKAIRDICANDKWRDRTYGEQECGQFQVRHLLAEIRRCGVRLVFLIDDINDALSEQNVGNARAILRSLVSEGHLLAICTSGLWPHEIDYSTSASPWYNVFQIRTLGLFETADSLDMLYTLSRRSGYEFSESECLFLIDMLGNHPFHLQSAGLILFGENDYARIAPQEKKRAIKHVAQELFRHHLMNHIHLNLRRLSQADLRTLFDIAAGSKSIKEQNAWSLSSRGFIVRDDATQRWLIPSRGMKEFLATLPEPAEDKNNRSRGILDGLLGISGKVLETALEKAIEVAAKIYLS